MEETITETEGLLAAILAWRLNGMPLEQLKGAREYVEGDPENLEDVRLIQRILEKYRKPGTPLPAEKGEGS